MMAMRAEGGRLFLSPECEEQARLRSSSSPHHREKKKQRKSRSPSPFSVRDTPHLVMPALAMAAAHKPTPAAGAVGDPFRSSQDQRNAAFSAQPFDLSAYTAKATSASASASATTSATPASVAPAGSLNLSSNCITCARIL